MSEFDPSAAFQIVNLVSGVLFLLLAGVVLFSMMRRIRDYRRAREALPVLLKRGFVLFTALALIGGETLVIRAWGINLMDYPFARLIYSIQTNVVLLIALGYYAKAELFDIDDPDQT
jgi:hypothetical protein